MKTRKQVTMTMTVSVPIDMSSADARREVRSLVNEQCNYSADYGDVKVAKLGPQRQQYRPWWGKDSPLAKSPYPFD